MWLSMTLGARPSLRTLSCVLGACLALFVLLGLTGAAPARAASNPMQAVLLASSVTNDTTDPVTAAESSLEYQEAEADGYTVTPLTDSQWEAKTTADFETYQLIIIGDLSSSCSDAAAIGSVAQSTASTWEPAVMNTGGNKVLIGTDPSHHYHLNSSIKAPQLEQNSLAYAGAVSGATGLYLDLGCSFDSDPAATDEPILDGLTSGTGQFGVEGYNSFPSTAACDTTVNIVAATGPTSGLTDEELGPWDCSVHEVFTSFPSDYTPLVLAPTETGYPNVYCANDVETMTKACGAPYILVSGGGVSVSSDISLSPASQDVTTSYNTAPNNASVTATVTSGGSPSSGQQVTFTVNGGPDKGKTATATTDSAGHASFTIANNGSPGSDSVSAIFTNASGNVEKALATVNFQGPGQVTASTQNLTGTEKTSLGTPTVATFIDSSATAWNTTVNWGDGTPADTNGTVTPTGTANQYRLNADHTYTSPGLYTVTVTITDAANSADTTTDTFTADISKGQVAVSTQSLNLTAGMAFSGQVASFTNTDTSTNAGNYTATVDWGDGTSPSSATVTGGPGSFTVTPTTDHTYAKPGSYPVKVTITGGDDPTTTTSDTATATVSSPPTLTVTGRGTLQLPTETLSGTLATVHYATPSAPASGFTAAIKWGDGTTGTGTLTGSGGNYTLTGSHTYSGAGPYQMTVTVTDPADGTASATTTVLVPSSVAALGLPSGISAKKVLCGVKRHAKCTGLTILGTFRSPGNATWNVSMTKSGRHPVLLGRVTRVVSAGSTKLVFKVTNHKQAKRLYKLVKKHRLNQLSVQQVFTNLAGTGSTMSLSTRVSR
jgi:hypothetical protein